MASLMALLIAATSVPAAYADDMLIRNEGAATEITEEISVDSAEESAEEADLSGMIPAGDLQEEAASEDDTEASVTAAEVHSAAELSAEELSSPPPPQPVSSTASKRVGRNIILVLSMLTSDNDRFHHYSTLPR